uniref:Phosphoribosylaminoimidazole-succinocarboxamide synthase, chloroplastic n=1 Tax=Rhodosorus marinus TaxID=101924 RepID=A0A7S0BUG7_9RHOD
MGNTFGASEKKSGKVRDQYLAGDKIYLVTTDRQSAFDRVLAAIPFKGQVLNLSSAWWFKKTEHIIPNHVLSVPHPYVTVAKKCSPFPVEFVVRGYITGSTSTSLWTNYKNGVRNYCGINFPEGLIKNQKLEENVLTPTTKEEFGDKPISPAEIVSSGLMTQQDFDACAKASMELFAYGQELARENGLILVDTKYEFGKDADGVIRLIDEVHTPDSSRFWIAPTFDEKFKKGENPENVDKEFLRLWFSDNCDPYKDEILPEAPQDLVVELGRRYIMLFQLITGEDFDTTATPPSPEAIAKSIS